MPHNPARKSSRTVARAAGFCPKDNCNLGYEDENAGVSGTLYKFGLQEDYEPEYDYVAVQDAGCWTYIHMDSGNYGTTQHLWGGSVSLARCAAAVRAYDGTDGCIGDFFYYEPGWNSGSGYCACEPRRPRARARAASRGSFARARADRR